MVRSISCGLRPRPTDSEPWGSKSTSSTLRPYSASEAPRLMVVVVLPTPPFWLHIDTTLARPWVASGPGSGKTGIGRPVGPSSAVTTGSTGCAASTSGPTSGWVSVSVATGAKGSGSRGGGADRSVTSGTSTEEGSSGGTGARPGGGISG